MPPKKARAPKKAKTSKQIGGNILKRHVESSIAVIKDLVSSAKKALFFPPNKLPGGSQKTLNAHAQDIIQSITVRREPINSVVNKALNVLTFGAFKKAMKDLAYDKMFHLSMVIKTNKTHLTLEKNERINLSTTIKRNAGTEQVDVPWSKSDVSLDQFLENARKSMGDHRFFQYNAFQNNCQDFLWGILKANGAASPDVVKFIKQDAEKLVSKMPSYIKKIAQFATDTAGKITQVMSGQGPQYAPDESKFYVDKMYRNRPPDIPPYKASRILGVDGWYYYDTRKDRGSRSWIDNMFDAVSGNKMTAINFLADKLMPAAIGKPFKTAISLVEYVTSGMHTPPGDDQAKEIVSTLKGSGRAKKARKKAPAKKKGKGAGQENVIVPPGAKPKASRPKISRPKPSLPFKTMPVASNTPVLII